jgi:cell wall-associated NlpC family hydrolase
MTAGAARIVVTGLVAVLLTGCAGPASPAGVSGDPGATTTSVAGPARRAAAPALVVGHAAWVAVSVATLWHTPDSPRPVDAPALRAPAEIGTWLADMTVDERRGLGGRADTQALLGDRVVVVALPSRWPGWARVVVPSQPTPLDRRGYPGWVPRRQLTAQTPTTSSTRATVLARTTWLRADTADGPRLFRVSFGTDLPLVAVTPTDARVALPTGRLVRLARSAVVLHDPGRPALAPTRAGIVRSATRFVGLPYLWSGVSGFGFDCSGLTWLDYRVHGIRIPRDAAPQWRRGRPAAPPARGDLMFYAAHGVVHHVTMYVGNGRMVHSPSTGHSIEVIATSTPAYARGYVGARRYLPAPTP